MAATRITITLDEEQLRQVRSLVASGGAASVSSFLTHAVRIALHDAQGWKEMLEQALEETGGHLTDEERLWADSVLNPTSARRG